MQIEPGVEGLVHVSEASHGFTKNINEVVKVGDIVKVKILAIDEESRRITLSIKACLPEDAIPEAKPENEEDKVRKPRAKKTERKPKDDDDSQKEWKEDSSNNQFADLLKNLDIKD